jgi:hypothetical protein
MVPSWKQIVRDVCRHMRRAPSDLAHWQAGLRGGVASADEPHNIMSIGHMLQQLPRALDFRILLRISGGL